MRLGLYARVSTQEQQTLALQRDAMVAYAAQRGGAIVLAIEEISSGAQERRQRDVLMQAARRRAIDAIVVWRLDRWGRSLADLIGTLQELQSLGVGFISLSEALDLTTPVGRAMAGLLAIFAEFEREILRERVKAGIAKPAAGGHGMGVHRLWGIMRRKCSASRPQGSANRRLPGAWVSAEPRCGDASR